MASEAVLPFQENKKGQSCLHNNTREGDVQPTHMNDEVNNTI